MSGNEYFRSHETLWTFFSDVDLITVTGIRDFCQTRGVILFSQERQGIPKFPSYLLYGIAGLRQLALYINAQPLAVAGFTIGQNKRQLTMPFADEPLISLLDRCQDQELNEDGLKLHALKESAVGISGKVRYYRSVAAVDMLPSAERTPEDANFFAMQMSSGDNWIVFVIMQKVRDFRVVLTAMQIILSGMPLLQWELEVVSLDQFQDTETRHRIFKEFIDQLQLSGRYECLGIMGFSGRRDFDIEPGRLFDAVKDARQASLHQIFPVDRALEDIRGEGAYVRSLELVLIQRRQLLIVEMKGKTDRMEVSVIDKKDMGRSDPRRLQSADDIKSLQTIYISNEERVEIARDIWELFFNVLKTRTSAVTV